MTLLSRSAFLLRDGIATINGLKDLNFSLSFCVPCAWIGSEEAADVEVDLTVFGQGLVDAERGEVRSR